MIFKTFFFNASRNLCAIYLKFSFFFHSPLGMREVEGAEGSVDNDVIVKMVPDIHVFCIDLIGQENISKFTPIRDGWMANLNTNAL